MVQKEDCPQRSAYRESGFVLTASLCHLRRWFEDDQKPGEARYSESSSAEWLPHLLLRSSPSGKNSARRFVCEGILIPLLHFGRPIAASRFPLRKHSSRRLARRGRKTVLLQDQVRTRDEQFAGWFTEASEVFQRNRIKEVISDLVYVFVDCGIQFFREGAHCVRLQCVLKFSDASVFCVGHGQAFF
jgi:hypothetical protein